MMREYLGSAVVQVKPLNGKCSWTTHDNREQATNQAARNHRHNLRERTRFCYRVNVYSKRIVMVVTAYSFDPSESLGKVLKVCGRVNNIVTCYEVSIEFFRKIALNLRPTECRQSSREFNYEDGLRVGRFLTDKAVIIENNKVVETLDV